MSGVKRKGLSITRRAVLKYVDCYDLLKFYKQYDGPRREVFVFCPFHIETKPSARAYGTGLIWCFGCHKLIDPVSFVMQTEDVLEKEAIVRLQKYFGFKLDLSKISLDDIYEGDKEVMKLKASILFLKYKIPFPEYKGMWQAFDEGFLTTDFVKKIRDGYRC